MRTSLKPTMTFLRARLSTRRLRGEATNPRGNPRSRITERTRRLGWLLWSLLAVAVGRADEARLLRYPHYHEGKVVFTYYGDIWTAAETGEDVRRLTVHVERDVYPRFSPDGRWIAFSSARQGNLDIYVMPAEGGTPRQLTYHSADDITLGWTPDGSAVLFSSNRREDFQPKLYTVELNGGMPRPAGPDMGLYASYAPDGVRLAYNAKSQVYWRKGYRGAHQSDVIVMDLAARKFEQLTDFDGMDTWPMWGSDGYIYFVSDRGEAAVANLWRAPERGGRARAMTEFADGEVRWPALSADGKVIVFERDFGIWKLDLAAGRAEPLPIRLAAETQQNLSQMRTFRSELDDYDLAPSGRRLVFSIHGEVFTAPVKEGDLVQVTNRSARDQAPRYAPDGKSIAFISDASGREELYIAGVDGKDERRLSDLDVLKLGFAWSPESDALAFTATDLVLRKVKLDGELVELDRSAYGTISPPLWSPDGRWIAYAKPDAAYRGRLHLVGADGGEARRLTEEPFSERAPAFSPDGRKLFFIRSEGIEGLGEASPAQIHVLTLSREERDPLEPTDADAPAAEASEERRPEAPPETRPEGEPPQGEQPAEGEGERPHRPDRARAKKVEPIEIDWEGLRRRTRQVTRMPYGVTTFTVTPDGKTVVFVTREPAGDGSRTVPVIYRIEETGKNLTRVLTGSAGGDETAEEERPGPPEGGIADLTLTADGRTLFFREGRSVHWTRLPAAAEGGAAVGARGTRERVNFTVSVRIDQREEWPQMFEEAWRTMKYRFYDPAMHGVAWDRLREKYRPMVEHVGDRTELMNLINEMIGELNASHTGANPGPRGSPADVQTHHPGLDLEPDAEAGRYRVTHIYRDGPADKDWVRVAVGDWLIAIAGEPVRAGDNYWRLLNHRLNPKVEFTFNNEPRQEGAWTTRIEPASLNAFGQLRYERWVRERREMTDRLSDGRVGYVHIQAMNAPSLRKFQRELREYREKEALVIDQRWNGGGNIEQELLGLLVQREYQLLQPRGTEPTLRPASGYFGPKAVLQNWRSGSNAEMFPAGFKALGLGKVIGTPTYGGVIGTGSHRLIDGSTVRTPSSGVYLADRRRTNMENYGVPPDIHVENSPEDNLAGRDRQLEVAVEELLKELRRRR